MLLRERGPREFSPTREGEFREVNAASPRVAVRNQYRQGQMNCTARERFKKEEAKRGGRDHSEGGEKRIKLGQGFEPWNAKRRGMKQK